MGDTGKVLVGIGLAIVLVGAALWGLGKAGFRGLPGDLKYESENVRVYFPIVTCIVLSLLLSVGMWLWGLISRR